jgi:hypothetical protein
MGLRPPGGAKRVGEELARAALDSPFVGRLDRRQAGKRSMRGCRGLAGRRKDALDGGVALPETRMRQKSP